MFLKFLKLDKIILKNILNDELIILANFIDHFNTSLYVFMVPILSKIFFPSENIIISNIAAYSVLLTSIITKPVGSYIFGILARITYPAKLLVYTITCTAASTAIMSLLPSYKSIGNLAPIILILLRIVQGIFTAGENTISSLYLLHNKSDLLAKKNNYIYETSSILGLAIASIISTAVIYIDKPNIWRICFFISGLVGTITCYLRYKQFKQISFTNINNTSTIQNNSFGIKVLLRNKKKILKIILLTNCTYITYYIPIIFMNNFVPLITDITLEKMMSINNFLLVFDVVALPTLGRTLLSCKTEYVLLIAISILTVTIIPLWYLLYDGSIFYISFMRLWIVFFGIIITCQMNFYFSKLFRTNDKYLIIGFSKAISSGIFGKTLPAACLLIFYITNNSIYIAIYLFIIFFMGLIALKI